MERVLGQFKEDRKEGTYHTMTFENAKRGVIFLSKRGAVGKIHRKLLWRHMSGKLGMMYVIVHSSSSHVAS